ncbi:MAG: molybdate ABC transporter permease subunit [Chloroflexota bacterium]|nr:MAG: molybdate ABC transporter permease subunit [Chloroflexota bacterium]
MNNREIRKSPPAPPAKIKLSGLWRVMSLPMLIFLSVPIVALFLRTSPSSLVENLRQPSVLQAIGLSLATTLVSTLIIILAGTPLAYAQARGQFHFSRLIDTLIDLPLVLPPAVAGVALLMAFGRRGLFGEILSDLGIHIAFTPLAVILVQVFVAAPFYIKSASLGFSNIDQELEQSAALDGASSPQVFRFLTIPLSWSALLGGSVMSWARALGEFGATIIFAGNFPGRTQTMPLAIYIGFELDLDIALTLSVILILLSFLALLIAKNILQRDWMSS